MPATYGEMLLNDPRIPRDTDIQARLREGLKPYWDRSIGFCYVGKSPAKAPAALSRVDATTTPNPTAAKSPKAVVGVAPTRATLKEKLQSYFRQTTLGWKCDALDCFAGIGEFFLAGYATVFDVPTNDREPRLGYQEILRRGAFRDSLDDCELWVGHKERYCLATTHQHRRLTLIEDEFGLAMLACPMMSRQALGTIQCVAHGDFPAMSLDLQPDPAAITFFSDRGTKFRATSRVSRLSEVSIVPVGANPSTVAIVPNYTTPQGDWRAQLAVSQLRDHMREQATA